MKYGLCATMADALDDLLLPYTIDLSVFAEIKHHELKAHIQRDTSGACANARSLPVGFA